MFKTKVAAVGILASSVCIVDQVGAVQLVSDQKNTHQQKSHDWNPDLSQDQSLLATRKQLDEVEEQLNQMKAETEVNLEIAEQESSAESHHAKSKRHSKKNKHLKKKNKKRVQQEEAAAPSQDEAEEQVVHAKRRHGGHKKPKHSSDEAASNEEDPFDTFEASLTKGHHKGQEEKHHQQAKPQAEEKDAVLRQIDQIANDISVTQKNTAKVQAKLSKKHAAPVQEDNDLTSTKADVHLKSDPICNSAGCTQYLHPNVERVKDYDVPNLGKDHDILSTEKSEKTAEEIVHKYDEQEMTGVTEDMRMESKSDPICSSAGCDQYKHPHKDTFKMNYFVPNFGKDHDIEQTDKNAESAEAYLGHTWTPKFDEENDKWIVPTETAEFKLAGVEADMQMGKHKRKHKNKNTHSDPSCTSSGWCGESLWPSHRAKEDAHAVLRSNTDRGANQVPLEEELKANNQQAKDNASEPHPDSKGPNPEDNEEAAESKKSSEKTFKKSAPIEVGKQKETKKETAEDKVQKKVKEEKEEETVPEGNSKRKTSGLLSDDEFKESHSKAQTKAVPQSFASIKRSHHHKDDDEKPKKKAASKEKKNDLEDSCASRKGSSQVSEEEWQKCHESLAVKNKHHARKQKSHHKRNKQESSDPICSSSGWCGEPWPDYMKDKRDIVEYKTGLPLDKDIRDTQQHISDQEAEHGVWKMGKDPSDYRGQKHARRAKNEQRLQTQVDEMSDPAFNSDDGYETRHMNPSDEKEIVKYKTDLPYDSDIATTQNNLKESETKQSHKLDPIPFLAQQASTSDNASQEQETADQEATVAPPQVITQQPKSGLQQNSSDQTIKTAVKAQADTKQKVEAKAKVQTKQEKMNSFVAMRKSMMSNWGTK